MIGLDTNVLLRVLVDDGSRDVKKVRSFVAARATEGQIFFIDTVVLAEVAWVLESVFDYARAEIAAAIGALLNNAAYLVDGRDAAGAALGLFRAGKADYSDCLIVARTRQAGCERLVTLDKAMKDLPDVALI